jgi:hypothetical protein
LEQLARALVGRQVGPGELFRILAELQPAFAPQPRGLGPQPPQRRERLQTVAVFGNRLRT